jgi:hypothetical protein
LSTNDETASYTLVLADAAKVVEMNVSTANNLTVPLNSSVAFPIGTQILVLQTGTGQTTIVATSGVTINSVDAKLKLSKRWSSAVLIKRGTDTWVAVGDLSAWRFWLVLGRLLRLLRKFLLSIWLLQVVEVVVAVLVKALVAVVLVAIARIGSGILRAVGLRLRLNCCWTWVLRIRWLLALVVLAVPLGQ